MNLTNFKIVLRLIKKQKLPSLLSIFVLTLGMTSFLLIFFYIQHEKNFDRLWKAPDQIFRLALKKTLPNGSKTTSATNYPGLCRVLADEIPEIECATGLWPDVVTAFTTEHFLKDARFYWSDANVFKVFNRPFIAGDATNPFPTIQSAVISEKAALTLFGQKDPLNEHFKLNEGWEFVVAGVFADIPENSHLKADILISRESLYYYITHFDNATSKLRLEPITGSLEPPSSSGRLWRNPQAYTYFRLKKNVKISSVSQKFPAIYKKYTSHLIEDGQKSAFILQPVKSIHANSDFEQEISPNTDSKTISALYIIAFLILVMSWIIFVNFQITQIIERAKEIGLKKVGGASSSGLLSQITLQSVMINAFSILLALGLFFALRGQLSRYVGINGQLPVHSIFLLRFIGLFIAGSFLSGIYPAFILISKRTQMLLSNRFAKNNDGFTLRRSLIVFQFAASIGLLIGTITIIRQVSFMKNKDVGLKIKQTAYSFTPMSLIKKEGATQKLVSYMNEINKLPGIKATTVSSCIPGKEISFHSNHIYPEGKPELKGDNFGILNIDHRFQEVFEPKLLAGKIFTEEDSPEGTKLAINRAACKTWGFPSPEAAVGKFVEVEVNDFLSIPKSTFQICGVIEDFHQESPRKKIEPLLLMHSYRWKYDVGYITTLFDGSALPDEMLSALKKEWEKFFPVDPFEIKFTNEKYQLQMSADKKLAGIFSVYTFLSVLLAVLGLFGLAANSIQKRTKEIGIRKVNGAKITEVMAMLNADFIKWVILSFVIAVPVAWYTMQKWLEKFASKTDMSWWIFVLAGLLTLGIALLTVSFQSYKAATRNPVESLKYE
ncbi:ABC transporter permease [Maribellus maritimus]|uniref:ABC transporter permease n=1 Tax=Maribellus maritimus TaxID=2870838 RepID=UPI001EEA8C27|nr:ABC transporter permease [Maribellus maritimus]MCG6189808.1 ABC transporter permease [Maribellus maritimus]